MLQCVHKCSCLPSVMDKNFVLLIVFMAMHTLISVRQKEPAWIEEGAKEYLKRLGVAVAEVIVRPPSRSLGKPAAQLMAQEGEAIVRAINAQKSLRWVVALDVQGNTMSTDALASALSNWLRHYSHVIWVIGGADGLAPEVLALANLHLSLSPMTFPHHLARLILLEQIYRATTLNVGHPYHRA